MHKEASFFDDSLTRTGEILTQGFLSESISTALTFVFCHGKQQDMNSSCNWSNFGEIWKKSRNSDEFKLKSCKRGLSVVEDNDNISAGIEEISRSCFDSTIKKMCAASSSPIKDGFVYKRRKMQRNTVALMSGENATEVTVDNTLSEFNLSSSDYHLALHEDSSDGVQEAVDLSSDCQDNERPSFSGRHYLDADTTFNSQLIDHKNLESVKKCANNGHGSATAVSHSAEEFTDKLCCSTTGNCDATNGTFVASKSCVPCASILTVAGEHSGDCSTSGAIFLESLERFESPEEMCIYVLKRHGLLGESNRNGCVSLENLSSVGPLFSPCKICGISESALRMLICDDCEEAFHLSCCRPKIKRLPRDEWYCQSCFLKKRKHLLRKNMGTSSGNVGGVSESGGPIASMLRDSRPHRSRVRIGEDFQVEVSDWSEPFSNDDYFGEAKEMDHAADCCSFEGWSWSKSSKSCSIGNWLQCKEEDDNGNICGKWRRAPLFSIQTDDWDCSCAVLWDPIHSDCAVPQELDTEEVLKHLKFVEMVRNRLNNKMKPD